MGQLMMMAQVAGNGTLKNLKGPKGLGRETPAMAT
jgi:hypothetical protein